MSHPSPEKLKAVAGGHLPSLSTCEVVLHLRECTDCHAVFAEARESLLIEEELARDPINSIGGAAVVDR
jgi:anti-sigma factor ChrR (cupin superfamily)